MNSALDSMKPIQRRDSGVVAPAIYLTVEVIGEGISTWKRKTSIPRITAIMFGFNRVFLKKCFESERLNSQMP